MKEKSTVERSQFANTYGGLVLVLGDDGKHYLGMDDCFGRDYFGPLTDAQIAAFYLLNDVDQVQG